VRLMGYCWALRTRSPRTPRMRPTAKVKTRLIAVRFMIPSCLYGMTVDTWHPRFRLLLCQVIFL
jgi:hypothetical protein